MQTRGLDAAARLASSLHGVFHEWHEAMNGRGAVDVGRGVQGGLPRLPTLAEESYQDFVEGLRGLVGSGMAMPAMRALHGALGVPPAPSPPIPRATLRRAGDGVPLLAVRNRMLRSSQQMMWQGLTSAYGARRAVIEAALSAAHDSAPGALDCPPDFVVPDYARREFHIQPGGYQGDALTGPVYHYGTKVFFVGTNDDDAMHAELARLAPVPTDGVVRRALDLGCAIGQGTTSLKRRFPDAEVTGIDVSAPLLRYAHARARAAEVAVRLCQRNAEDTGFAAAEFDFVQSVILFHEVPLAATRRIVREMFRLLRPGGVFNVFDFPAGEPLPAGLQYFLDIDHRYNGEPWSPEFIYADFTALLHDAGFTVERGPVVQRYLRTWFCRKPD